ncbi:hypothetical protein [Kordiimonas sp.]|uniref:hypothetical protein n=1 Tax=Kordiimonas sp. TaxID=1970157 RepID=UPI003A8E9E8D
MLRNACRTGLLGLSCALLLLTLPAGAEETSESDQLTLYRAVSYYSDEASFDSDELKNSLSEKVFAKLMQDAGWSMKIRYLPLKRAISLYQADPEGCVVAPLPVNTDLQQSSDIYYMNPFWIYVLKDRGFKTIADLRSFGSIDGSDDFIGHTILGDLERMNAPSFQVLMAMLRSRRVDAIPLGELAQMHEPEVGKTIVRLSEEPFLLIPHRLRCKRTPKTALMLEAVNRVLAENPAPHGVLQTP